MHAAAQPPRADVRHCVALFVDLHAFCVYRRDRSGGSARLPAALSHPPGRPVARGRRRDHQLHRRTRDGGVRRDGGARQRGTACRGRRTGLARGDSRPCLQQRPLVPAAHRRGERRTVRGSLLRCAGCLRRAGEPGGAHHGAGRTRRDPGVGLGAPRPERQRARRPGLGCDGARCGAAGALEARRPTARHGRVLVGGRSSCARSRLDACQTARAGHVLLVRGEAGIGKSRLRRSCCSAHALRLSSRPGAGLRERHGGGAVPVLARAPWAYPAARPRAARRGRAAGHQTGLVGRDLAPFLYELPELPIPAHPSEEAGQA